MPCEHWNVKICSFKSNLRSTHRQWRQGERLKCGLVVAGWKSSGWRRSILWLLTTNVNIRKCIQPTATAAASVSMTSSYPAWLEQCFFIHSDLLTGIDEIQLISSTTWLPTHYRRYRMGRSGLAAWSKTFLCRPNIPYGRYRRINFVFRCFSLCFWRQLGTSLRLWAAAEFTLSIDSELVLFSVAE